MLHNALERHGQLDRPQEAVETHAALARLYHAQGAPAAVGPHLAPVLAALDADPALAAAERPLRVHLTVYQLLADQGAEAEAAAILARAHQLLQAKAALIAAGPDRDSFLNNVGAHRAIIAAFESGGNQHAL